MANYKDRLSQLQKQMRANGVAAYIAPSNDEFMNEYVPHHARRLQWLTGFSGSAGTAVILQKKAVFFTDGRYILQSKKELPKGEYEILNIADITLFKWLKNNLKNKNTLGLNPLLFSADNILKYEKEFPIWLGEDLIDKIWLEKPNFPLSKIKKHPVKYSGQNHIDKINNITLQIRDKKADMILITAPDSICWLLNLRASDVPNTPLLLSRLLLNKDGSGVLFANIPSSARNKFLEDIKIEPLDNISQYLQKISGKKIMLDKSTIPHLFFSNLKDKNKIINLPDPVILPKACKNNIEVKGAVNAHMADGAAICSFLYWLKKNYEKESVTELSIDKKLLEFRQKNKNFIEPSFSTIAGFAGNGAIIHYSASKETSKKIEGNGLLLIDSGGQYLDGTTDITRTIAIGKPTKEQKRNFTLVLKGHIALASAVFPQGTSGHQLDILARKYLWQNNLDYDHGTGHGVGSFLGVHEGPQRISKAPNNVALQKGMIISNEPGYYKQGQYGIRIESLVVVEEASIKNSGSKKFLKFNTLTCAPIDEKLIDFSLLDKNEKKWLTDYHRNINKKLSGLVDLPVAKWLDGLYQSIRQR